MDRSQVLATLASFQNKLDGVQMEQLKHECGIAMVRLRKPLTYYQEKYGTWRYGLNKMYLLMEKQHNRGQDGAGIACVKLTAPTGEEYMYRERVLGNTAIAEIFASVEKASRCMDKISSLIPTLLKHIFPTPQSAIWVILGMRHKAERDAVCTPYAPQKQLESQELSPLWQFHPHQRR